MKTFADAIQDLFALKMALTLKMNEVSESDICDPKLKEKVIDACDWIIHRANEVKGEWLNDADHSHS